jgi:hypothetical protein
MELLNLTRNLISPSNSLQAKDEDGVFLSPETYIHNWVPVNAEMYVVSEKYVHPLQYSFRIQPLDPDAPITIGLGPIIIGDEDTNGAKVQFHSQIFSDVGFRTSTRIKNGVSAESLIYEQTLTSGTWNTVWSPVIDVGSVDTSIDDINFDVEITITEHRGFVFYLSLPFLINELGILKNTFVYNMRKFLPTFIWDRDKIQEYPNYPFTKLLHSLTSNANHSTTLYTRYFEYLNGQISVSNSEEAFRYSQLVNPEYVDLDYISWLTQFNGTPVYRSIPAIGTEAESITNVEDSIRWQLTNSYFGRNAGTTEAIRECAKQVLTGSKVCIIAPGGSFFRINIYTIISETPGVVLEGDSSGQVLAMVEKARPMGFVLVHEAYTELPFILDDETYGVVGISPLA